MRWKTNFYTLFVRVFVNLCVGGSYLFFAPTVFGKELVFQDSFDHGLGQWELQQGLAENWTTGDGYLEGEAPRRHRRTELVVVAAAIPSDLVEYELEVEYEPLMGFDRNFGFSFIDDSNWSELHLLPYFFEFARVADNVASVLAYNFQFPNDKRYILRVVSQKTRLQVFVDGVRVLDTSDPGKLTTVPSRPFLRVTAGTVAPTRVRFHSVSVWRYEQDTQTQLPIELLKQHDPRWGDDIYDHADTWPSRSTQQPTSTPTVPPTMSRWGCAVTAAAMIFRYYGLQQFPDGTALLPGSLNHWLQSQQDGFLGEGLTNWLALTRLSREIATTFSQRGLPTFEFSRISVNATEMAAQFLTRGQPVIAEIPGHFLVLSGVLENSTPDFLIADPGYSYTKLSQHLHKPLQSLRVLTPSHTDLSYLLIVSDPADIVTIEPVALLQNVASDVAQSSYVEAATVWDTGQSGAASRITQIAKPPAGEYRVTIKRADDTLSPSAGSPTALPALISPPPAWLETVQVLVYQKDGTVSLLEKIPLMQPETRFSVAVEPTSLSRIQSYSHWQVRQDLLEWLAAYPQLPKFALRQLQRIANYAQQHPDANDRYQQLFQQMARFYALEYPDLCTTLFSIMPEQDANLLGNFTSAFCGTLSNGRRE